MAIRRDLSALLTTTPTSTAGHSMAVKGTDLRLEVVPVIDITCGECNRDTELELTTSWSDDDASTTVSWSDDQAMCSWCMHPFSDEHIHAVVHEQLSS